MAYRFVFMALISNAVAVEVSRNKSFNIARHQFNASLDCFMCCNHCFVSKLKLFFILIHQKRGKKKFFQKIENRNTF